MSPDLNAPKGPKQPSSPIRLVQGKFDPEVSALWSAGFDGFELDTALWFGLPAAKRARYRKRLRVKGGPVISRTVLRPIREPEILAERLRLVEEELEGAVRLHVLASGRRIFEADPVDSWIAAIRESIATCRAPLALEWGEGDVPAVIRRWTRFLPEAGWVIDPDHHTIPTGPAQAVLHFKLHGWHPARWVRRYGAQRAGEIIERVVGSRTGAGETFLVLSHSGRVEESGVFSGAIESMER